MSEYDDRDPAPEHEQDAGVPRPDEDREDTLPVGAPAPGPVSPSYDETPAAPKAAAPTAAPPGPPGPAPGRPADVHWPSAAYAPGPFGHPGYPSPPGAPGGSGAVSPVPGWLWPVVAALALVVGLLGGTLGGVAVSRSLSGGGVDLPILGADPAALPPLDTDNESIAVVAQQLLPSTVQILAGNDGEGRGATGSGFVLDGRGHVITNNHVVAGATGQGEIQVVDNDGRTYRATIVGRSPVYDIAVLDVAKAADLRPAAIGSSRAMRVGEPVVAIGSPLGLSSTVTSGIVSALDRPVTTGTDDESSFINAVQTDAAINPGNSGGPLVNLRGEVVGVNSAIATTGGGFGGEAGNIGVGFAIPMEQVQVTATQILTTGEAKYPVIGANVNTGNRGGRGAEVVEVPAGTPADRAGLEKGDVVVAVDDKRISDGISLIVAIRSHQPGETVVLTVRRGSAEREVSIRLDAQVG